MQDCNVLGASLVDEQRPDGGMVSQQPSKTNIDFSHSRLLILGWQKLPQQLVSGQLQQLLYLELINNGVAELPPSFGELTQLRVLHFNLCGRLAALPDSIGQLLHLKRLHLECCFKLTALPESVGNLSALRGVLLEDCSRLSVLPASIGRLQSLKVLNLWGCSALAALPESCEELRKLENLVLGCCTSLVQPLPDST
jgi:Leucine-rich repeat (LRR) protein